MLPSAGMATDRRFQSTPSAGRATCFSCVLCCLIVISIHALRGEGDETDIPVEAEPIISIHALRGEGDRILIGEYVRRLYFNPRPPRGGRLVFFGFNLKHSLFQSTPSAGRATSGRLQKNSRIRNFNPRPPRGGRPIISPKNTRNLRFQSTPSAGRATKFMSSLTRPIMYFNPRPPRGGRHFRFVIRRGNSVFQSTPSAGRATARHSG